MIETKRCHICNKDVSIVDFYDGNGKQGREFSCKTCRKEFMRLYRRKIKQELMKAYGGHCSCCGETEICFLGIDHINGMSVKEKQEHGRRGYQFYLWLKRNGYPKDNYRILCHNCNMGRESNGGICPHQG